MLRPSFFGPSLLTLVIIALPSVAEDEVPPKLPPAKKAPEPKAPDPYVKVGQITAKVVSVEGSTNNLRLRIETKQINPSAAQALQRAQFRLQTARNPQERFNAQRDLINQQRNLYKTVSQDVSLPTTENVVVRVANPPPTFDEKGNLTRPNAAKLKELKGDDPRVPGYMANFSDIHAEQIVQVTLVKDKANLRPKPIARGKDVDLELLKKENTPMISMIIIVAEPLPK